MIWIFDRLLLQITTRSVEVGIVQPHWCRPPLTDGYFYTFTYLWHSAPAYSTDLTYHTHHRLILQIHTQCVESLLKWTKISLAIQRSASTDCNMICRSWHCTTTPDTNGIQHHQLLRIADTTPYRTHPNTWIAEIPAWLY